MSNPCFEIASCRKEVLDSTIHYLSCGEGDPILFLHGMPCSSYLWRQVLPSLAKSARCLAPDLMGLGESGKPGIPYGLIDHIRYLEAFIESMNLQAITLVVHGWGSIVGLDIASRLSDRFKRLVFCESHLRPVTDWKELSLPVQELLSQLGDREQARERIVKENFLIEKWLPSYAMKKLTEKEKEAYQSPFRDPISREVLLQYVYELPVGSGDDEATKIIRHYSSWLQKTNMPKLLISGIPGFITTMATISWAQDHLSNLTLAEIPDALHFIPQSSPRVFELAVNDWLQETS